MFLPVEGDLGLRSYRSGDASVFVINVGDFKLRLSNMLKVPEKDYRPKYGDLFDREILSPGNCILIKTTDGSIMVDPNDFAASCTKDSEYYPAPDYKAPPDLLAQLKSISAKPEDITHVVITHAHYDHYAGVTQRTQSGKYEPTFPNAKYYLGAADWESPPVKEGMQEKNSDVQNTLGVLYDRKMLELVSGPETLFGSVMIIPAHGESPGHQLLELQSSSGETFYCVGDLFHHWVEVDETDWGPDWADLEQNAETKRKFCETASSKKAIVIPGHMNPGRIVKKRDGVFHWEEDQT